MYMSEQHRVFTEAARIGDSSIWNNWRREHPDVVLNLHNSNIPQAQFIYADLSGVNLDSSNLARAVLFRAHFDEANLHYTDLRWTELREATFIRANLTQADLTDANLTGADLGEANLTTANLHGVYLRRTRLADADFTGAYFGDTVLTDVDLRTVKGLETVIHNGPSYMDIATLYKSQGEIPEVFMRGCGVPADLIALTKSLVGKPNQFYSCFISYSSQDEDLAERLHRDLQAQGVRVWFAPEDLRIGDPIKQTIDEAVHSFDKLILVLSSNSIERAWVRHEFSKAIEKEKENRRFVLFPIRLDDSVFETTEQWAYDIRQRHIGDFRKWKNQEDYQRAFTRLLRDLQAT